MKKATIYLFLTLFAGTLAQAQIVPENFYPGSATMTHLAVSGDKYYMMDYYEHQCEIYNLDHSLWKTIDLAIPADMYLYDIQYVSENLFDLDNLVELVYLYYHYDTTLYYYTYYTKVIKENGSELLSIPGCSFVVAKQPTIGTAKLFAYIYDYSVLPYTLQTGVYGLPGSLLSAPEFSEIPATDAGAPFPNPATRLVTIPYLMPESGSTGELVLMDQSGKTVQRFRLQPGSTHIQVSTESYSPGLYLYRIEVPGQNPANGKIMIR